MDSLHLLQFVVLLIGAAHGTDRRGNAEIQDKRGVSKQFQMMDR